MTYSMTPLRLANFCLFVLAVAACLAVEAVFMRNGIAFDARRDVQTGIIAVVALTAVAEAVFWHRDQQEPKARPPHQSGFDVIRKDKP